MFFLLLLMKIVNVLAINCGTGTYRDMKDTTLGSFNLCLGDHPLCLICIHLNVQMRLNKVSGLIHNSTNFQNLDSAGVSVHFQEIIDLVGKSFHLSYVGHISNKYFSLSFG